MMMMMDVKKQKQGEKARKDKRDNRKRTRGDFARFFFSTSIRRRRVVKASDILRVNLDCVCFP
jgi:hypothetical protein